MRGVLALRYVLPALAASIAATGSGLDPFLPDAPTYVIPSFSEFGIGHWVDADRGASGRSFLGRLCPAESPGRNGTGRRTGAASPHRSWRWDYAPRCGCYLVSAVARERARYISDRVHRRGSRGLVADPHHPKASGYGNMCAQRRAGRIVYAVADRGRDARRRDWDTAVVVLFPGVPAGLFCLLGAGAVLAATTQGPISTVVLLMELTGRDRSVHPAADSESAGLAILVARTIEPRSIYDARLNDEELAARQKMREQALRTPLGSSVASASQFPKAREIGCSVTTY